MKRKYRDFQHFKKGCKDNDDGYCEVLLARADSYRGKDFSCNGKGCPKWKKINKAKRRKRREMG